MNDINISSYIRKNKKYFGLYIFLFFSFNLYFMLLLKNIPIKYLLYLDFLIIVVLLIFFWIDYFKFRKMEIEKKELLQCEEIIYQEIPIFENKEIVEHDIRILQEKMQKQFEVNCDLQDYMTKWCHEVKIPLAAGLLINEKITDVNVRITMRENLEKINQQLNTMLLGCKLQSSLFDLQLTKVSLQKCIKTSIRNNQFFLIQKHFSIDVQIGEFFVYTDPSWIVYILDQLLNNAIKYKQEHPCIKIWTEKREERDSLKPSFIQELHGTEDMVKLFIEDNGVGIKESDIRRIFEKGFTGSNYHNGKYKSTGMGLYMVSKIAERLGHEIQVESEYGSYTRFCIIFLDNRKYFYL